MYKITIGTQFGVLTLYEPTIKGAAELVNLHRSVSTVTITLPSRRRWWFDWRRWF